MLLLPPLFVAAMRYTRYADMPPLRRRLHIDAAMLMPLRHALRLFTLLTLFTRLLRYASVILRGYVTRLLARMMLTRAHYDTAAAILPRCFARHMLTLLAPRVYRCHTL